MKKKLLIKNRFETLYNYGEDHPNWKGGKTKHAGGYILINTLTDPMFNGKPQVLEHRYVMAKFLGRELNRDEHVHHKNGDRTDNRIENLELMTAREHALEHQSYRKGKHFTLKQKICKKCNQKFYPKSCHSNSPQKFCCRKCYIDSFK